MATDYLPPAEARAYPCVYTALDRDCMQASRRAFLSAAAIAPAALAIPAVTLAATPWDAAARRVRETKAVYDAFAAAKFNPMNDAFDAGLISYDQLHVAEREASDIASAHTDAVNAMALVPVPTLAALHWKLATAHTDRLFDGTEISDRALDAITADLARLGGLV